MRFTKQSSFAWPPFIILFVCRSSTKRRSISWCSDLSRITQHRRRRYVFEWSISSLIHELLNCRFTFHLDCGLKTFCFFVFCSWHLSISDNVFCRFCGFEKTELKISSFFTFEKSHFFLVRLYLRYSYGFHLFLSTCHSIWHDKITSLFVFSVPFWNIVLIFVWL